MYLFLTFVFLYSLCSFHIHLGVDLELYTGLNLVKYSFMNKIKTSAFLIDFHTYFQRRI